MGTRKLLVDTIAIFADSDKRCCATRCPHMELAGPRCSLFKQPLPDDFRVPACLEAERRATEQSKGSSK